MDWETIDNTGAELRSLGHRRSELVEAIQWAWERSDLTEAGYLVAELGTISRQCQELLSLQYDLMAGTLRHVQPSALPANDAAFPPEV